ncbi:MAG: hypothetical protein KR126chlam1_00812 [Chlamydiae bacterium]|nr:hypothetical protein [Chlamydiota bacterium]
MIFGDRKAIKPHEAHELFWLMFDIEIVPMATWSFDGAILNANKAFLEMIGYTQEEFESKAISWISLTPKEYLPLDNRCIEELKGQHVASPYEKEYMRKDGTRIKARLHNICHDLGASGKGLVVIVPLDLRDEIL